MLNHRGFNNTILTFFYIPIILYCDLKINMDSSTSKAGGTVNSESSSKVYLRDINEGYLLKYTENRMWAKVDLESVQVLL